MIIRKRHLLFAPLLLIFCFGCHQISENAATHLNQKPRIKPDYSDITIPSNIAPVNFIIEEPGNHYEVKFSNSAGTNFIVSSGKGDIRIPERKWNSLIQSSKGDKIKVVVSAGENNNSLFQYNPFYIYVADEEIDPYLVYRLIHPGYYNWSQIKIVQRSLETFDETSVIDNVGLQKNCVNCHSFNQNDPNQYLIHVRGSEGGTYINNNNSISRHEIKTDEMPGSATYPAWHPEGDFITFSSNQVRQNFYAHPEKSIEVYDLISTLVLYDLTTKEVSTITKPDTKFALQTFPSWSPDGKFLYYCEADYCDSLQSAPGINDVKDLHYNLKKIPFDLSSKSFGKPELVFDAAAINKSVSFPRISPDGKYIIVTLTDYGTFPIWHREADLYLVNTDTGEYKYLELNSTETESYHSWSSNGRWLVFSSKRIDKRASTPFFAYFKDWDTIGKPFVLPQQNPDTYDYMLESFNIPEFVNGKISYTTRDYIKAAAQPTQKSIKPDNSAYNPRWLTNDKEEKRSDLEKGVHE